MPKNPIDSSGSRTQEGPGFLSDPWSQKANWIGQLWTDLFILVTLSWPTNQNT